MSLGRYDTSRHTTFDQIYSSNINHHETSDVGRMPADRLLGSLLRSLQPYSDHQDTSRLLGTAASLLTTLNNPLNVVLLTSQLLSAPAIWTKPDLATSIKCMGVFHSASKALVKHQRVRRNKTPDREFSALQQEQTLPQDEWIRAVVKGADEHSPRWRHVLVLGGLLLGFGPREHGILSRAMRSTIEKGFTDAVNLACDETPEEDWLGHQSVAMVLHYCFTELSHYEQSRLHFDKLLPILMRSSFLAHDGLASSHLLRNIDDDTRLTQDNRLQWPEQSMSYKQARRIQENPLIASLGSLARLIGYGLEHTSDPHIVMAVLDDLDDFSRVLSQQWRANKLSTVELSSENMVLDVETLYNTFPALWKVFRGIMFATVLITKSIIMKLLSNKTLARNNIAPDIAIQCLRILRHTYFIAARAGPTSFSQHRFVHLTSLDILAAHPVRARDFLYSIKPAEIGRIPQHPFERTFDLFFFNTTEHLATILDASTADALVIPAASAYITSSSEANMLPIFEAAHSVMLATFSAPQNADIANIHLPFYVGALFDVFPSSLPVRQFRYAYMTLMRIATPPSRLAAKQPMLSSTLLELLRERSDRAGTHPLPPQILGDVDAGVHSEPPPPLSEQAVLILTMIDTLTQLPLNLLGEWLPVTGDMINLVNDGFMREECKQHFWHTLINGDMDPERSRVCHAWWSTAGGREAVLYGRQELAEVAEMSGALPVDGSKL